MITITENITQEDIAKFIAHLAHQGQVRRPGILPYITHPEAVAESFPKEDIKARAVAWLHDVLEENKAFTPALLKVLGIDDDIIDAVVILTRIPGQTVDEYVNGFLESELPCRVKIADIKHNMSCQPSEKAKRKYPKILKRLEGGI